MSKTGAKLLAEYFDLEQRQVENFLEDISFVIVPKEPTKEMCENGNAALEDATDSGVDSRTDSAYTSISSTAPHDIYRAMIAAASPTPGEGE